MKETFIALLMLLIASFCEAQNPPGGYGPSVGGNSSSSSTSNPSSANMIDPTKSNGVIADGYIFADGTVVNGQGSFTSASQSCNPAANTAGGDVGKLAVAVNSTTGVYVYGTGLVTITGCNGNAFTLSANATQSIAGTAYWYTGTNATPGGTGGLVQMWNSYINATAPGAGRIPAMPCGVLIVTAPAFQAPGPNNTFNIRPDVGGCGGSGGTTIVFHPNVVANLPNGGNIFWKYSLSPIAGAVNYAGLGGNSRLKDLVLTSVSGNLPTVSGKTYSIYDGNGYVDNLSIFGLSFASGSTGNLLNSSSGETRFSHLNIQGIGIGSSGLQFYTSVNLSGQGTNSVDSSIFQSAGNFPAIACGGGTNCLLTGIYCAGCSSGITTPAGGAQVTIIGSTLNIGNGPAIGDGPGPDTFYIFGNPLIGVTTASHAAIALTNAGSIADISGSTISSATSGWNVSGAGTINDRAGNSWSSPLTQFTGKVNFIGGGSMVNTPVPASTNFGVAIGSTNLIASVLYSTPMGVYVNTRQITAGVGCGAGTNTATPSIQYTSPGGTLQTINPTVLSISANGTVDSGATAAQEFLFTAKIGTPVTYSVASVLASAGCSTTPQYAFDIKSGTN